MVISSHKIKLTEISNFSSGKFLSKEMFFQSGPIPVWGANGIIGYCSDPLYTKPVITIGRVGACGEIHKTNGPAWISDNALVVEPKENTDFRFLYYSLKALDFSSLIGGTTQPLITQTALKEQTILFFPLHEQRAIAHILGTLDDKIELNRRMNETLEAMAQALFKSWFVDFDPVRAKMEGRPTGLPKEIEDLFPDSFEDSELGEIPRGWEVVPLSKFSEIKGGKQLSKEMIYSSGQIPVFGGAGVMGYTHSFNAEGFIISFGRVGAYCGQFFYHRGKAWINNNASLVLFDRSMPGEWLFLVLKNLEIEPIKRGAAQPFISNSDLSALNILMPSFDLIISFQKILFPMFKKLEANLMENNLLCECREKLLPKLLSGEIRVMHLEKILERTL